MKTLWIRILFFFLSLSHFALAQQEPWKEERSVLWISKPQKTWVRQQTSCLLFDDYWVVTVEDTVRVGSDVFVFKRNPDTKFPIACDFDHSKAWVQYRDGDYDRVAIHGDYLFLDGGTDNWRGLSIISLHDKKEIAGTGYNGSVGKFSLVGDNLVYTGPLKETDDDRASWQIIRKCVWGSQHQPKEWFQEDYSGTRKINLKTGKKVVTEVICEVGQAAG